MTDRPPPLRIGSLCTGYGGLDMAVQEVLSGTVAWHCQYEPPDKDGREDTNQYAAQILAHHWPEIPNHGDLTAIDLSQVEPVDIVTAGFPCQDVSLAGLRAGIAEGTRSGLWLHVARAIEQLRPRLVVIENVEGLLSANADRGLGHDAEALEVEAEAGRVLRALGAVLGDLAALGFHAEWVRVAASEVGAPHQRKRVFLLAWPADAACEGRPGSGLRGRTAECGAAASDSHGVGSERGRARGGRRHEPASHDLAAADAASVGEREPADEADTVAGGRDARQVPGCGGGTPAADTDRLGRGELPAGRNAVRQRLRDDLEGRGQAVADPDGNAVREQPVAVPRRDGAAVAGLAGANAATNADGSGRDQDERVVRERESDVAWGEYEPAIRRWEYILQRPAPRPTDALGRLAPAFVEWMQGLPAGHVTGVPGLPRGAQLRALGNGVVPQQAVAAIRLLVARATDGVEVAE